VIPVLYFLLFLLLTAALAYGLTVRGMNGAWAREGPAAVAAKLRFRNRALVVGTLGVLVLAGVLEALLPDVSDAVLSLQYALGDALGADPALVWQTQNGTVSYGLYLGILLGVLLGALGGTAAAARRYPVLRGLPTWHL
jgi:hypothetical protein